MAASPDNDARRLPSARRPRGAVLALGIVLVVLLAALAALLVVLVTRQSAPSPPTGGPPGASGVGASPTRAASPSPPSTSGSSAAPTSASASPGQAALTRAQFDDLIAAQLPARGFPAPQAQPPTSLADIFGSCAALTSLGDGGLLAAGSYVNAIEGNYDPLTTTVALFTSAEAAARAMTKAPACAAESGDAVATPPALVGQVMTQEVFLTSAESGDMAATASAQYLNVLVVSHDPVAAAWDAFVSTAFPQAVDAALG